MFLPVLPTTIFFILALWCFKKSSPRMESWLLNHRLLGPTLRDWEESGSVKARTKGVAITLIWATILLSITFVSKPWVNWMLAGIAVALTWYLISRPTKAPDVASA